MLESDGVYDYEYDDEGNRTKRTHIASGDYAEYEWDYRNRLTAVRFKTSTGAITKQVEYEYDLLDRRIGKRVDANGDSVYESAYRSVYDGQDIVLVFDETGSLEERYLHGPAVDQVLAAEDPIGDVLWSLPDNQGSVREIVAYDAATDTTNIEKHRKFDAFGNITAESALAVDFLYAYTGREWDADAELYYYRARWYDPVVGRFLSEDPAGFRAGDADLYRYVENDPANWVDPTGFGKQRRLSGIYNGIKLFVDDDTAEFILENGKRITIRNAKFIDSTVSLDDLAKLTDVKPERIKRFREKYGDLSIRFDKCGQPDFSDVRKARVRIENPVGSDYGKKAWEQLERDDPKLYKQLFKDKENYQWHHKLDGSLELIDQDIHKAFQHTGLQSIWRQLGGLACMALPGVAKFQNGEYSDAVGEVAWEFTSLSWISDAVYAMFDSLWENSIGDERVYKERPYQMTYDEMIEQVNKKK